MSLRIDPVLSSTRAISIWPEPTLISDDVAIWISSMPMTLTSDVVTVPETLAWRPLSTRVTSKVTSLAQSGLPPLERK